jgi:hypothetical protein
MAHSGHAGHSPSFPLSEVKRTSFFARTIADFVTEKCDTLAWVGLSKRGAASACALFR